MRLTQARQFRAVYDARAKRVRGPLVAFVAPNGVGHWRLGLAVGRHVGSAVVRNRCKRLAREAFRLERERLPVWTDSAGCERGYDLVLAVRSGEPARLDLYRETLLELADALHRVWEKRRAREGEQSP